VKKLLQAAQPFLLSALLSDLYNAVDTLVVVFVYPVPIPIVRHSLTRVIPAVSHHLAPGSFQDIVWSEPLYSQKSLLLPSPYLFWALESLDAFAQVVLAALSRED
jgi:hypothetical protein